MFITEISIGEDNDSMRIGSGKASRSIFCVSKDDQLHLIQKSEFNSTACFIPEVGKTPLLDPNSTREKLPSFNRRQTSPEKSK